MKTEKMKLHKHIALNWELPRSERQAVVQLVGTDNQAYASCRVVQDLAGGIPPCATLQYYSPSIAHRSSSIERLMRRLALREFKRNAPDIIP